MKKTYKSPIVNVVKIETVNLMTATGVQTGGTTKNEFAGSDVTYTKDHSSQDEASWNALW